MPFLLRSLKKEKWNREQRPNWLCDNEVPKESVRDLIAQETGNKLSVWLIQDDSSNLEEVVLGMLSNRDHVEKFDYVLIDSEACNNLDIKIQSSDGKTPSKQANSWHRNLIELSGRKLMEIARVIYYEGERQRIKPSRVKKTLMAALSVGAIEESDLNDKMKISLKLIDKKICQTCGRQI
jgi:hypothetical protein